MEDRSAGRGSGDREPGLVRVLLLGGAVVAAVLGLQLLGLVFPPLDRGLALVPAVIVVLVAATLVMIVRALRAPGPPR